MKTAIYKEYGSPDVLQLTEVEKPTPKDNEVLIKIHATTVTAVDSIFRSGRQIAARLFTGLMRPKVTTLGSELAGEIEAVGKDVKRFKVGDKILAATAEFGAYAEYLCLPEEAVLIKKPDNMSYEEAAAFCDITALPFLQEGANLQRGQKILINGASGAIGTVAVQLAKHFGAEVTGVCSTRNVELVKSLGADQVIDYKKEDFTRTRESYDIIFDVVGKSSFAKAKGSLKLGGLYLTPVISLPLLLQMLWTSKFGNKKAKIVFAGLRPANEQVKDLTLMRELFEKGVLKAVIDQSYSLEQIVEAHSYVDQGHKRGNVVVTVA